LHELVSATVDDYDLLQLEVISRDAYKLSQKAKLACKKSEKLDSDLMEAWKKYYEYGSYNGFESLVVSQQRLLSV